MPLISALRQALENMPDSMKVDSVRNYLKKQGVKDAEIDNSQVLDMAHPVSQDGLGQDTVDAMMPQNGRITREQLLRREEERLDRTRMESYGSSYSSYTVPGTNPVTYQTRVYKNPVISGGRSSSHFEGSEDYFMHVRGDIISADDARERALWPIPQKSIAPDEAVSRSDLEKAYPGFDDRSWEEFLAFDNSDGKWLARFTLDSENAVAPTHGDKAIRIQEIQSDLANQDIPLTTASYVAGAPSGRQRYAATYDQFSHALGETFNRFIRDEETGLTIPPTMNLLDSLKFVEGAQDQFINMLKTDLLLDDASAQRVLAQYLNGSAEDMMHSRIDMFNDIPEAQRYPSRDDIEGALQDYLDVTDLTERQLRNGQHSNRDIPDFIHDEPEEFAQFAFAEYGLSKRQSVALAELLDEVAYFAETRNIDQYSVVLDLNEMKIHNVDPEEYKEAFDYPYVRQALYHEFDRAQEQGIREVQIAINPVGRRSLYRSEGVQRDHYEKTVKSTAEKVAKQIGATVEMKKGWLVIGLPAAGFTLPLYAQQGGLVEDKDASFLTTASELGYSDEEAKQALFVNRAKEQGYTDEEIQTFIAGQQSPATNPATAVGTTAGQQTNEPTAGQIRAIDQTLASQATDTNLLNADGTLNPAFNAIRSFEEQATTQSYRRKYESARNYIAQLEETQSIVRPYLEISRVWNSDQQLRLNQLNQELGAKVSELAAERGIDVTYEDGLYYVTDQNGQKVEASPSVIQQLWGDKMELAGAMAGATAGVRLAPPHWLAKALGGIVGGAIGSVAGSQLDYFNAAIQTRENIDGRIAFEKAVGAAEASIVYDTLFGVGVWAGVRAGKGLLALSGKGWRGLTLSYNMVKDGNTSGAYNAMKNFLGATDDQARDTIATWEKLNGMAVPTGSSLQQKALTILATTEPGGDHILRQVAATNPQASAAIRQEVNQRAQTLLDESRNVTDDNAAVKVLESMRSYVDDTKLYLETVKSEFVNNTLVEMGEKVDYTPQISEVFETIMDYATLDSNSMQFLVDRMNRTVDHARNIVEPVDLLEFRASLNSLKYSRSITNTKALNKIDELLTTVDGQIESIAINSLGEAEGKEWLEQWEEARESYSHMLIVQQNGLFNALTKESTAGKAVTPQTVARALVKYGPSIDDAYIRRGGEPVNTYEEIIDILPISTVRNVEGMIVQELVEKHTAGKPGGWRATHFPSLSEALSVYPFRTQEAQRIKMVVDELGKLYKNDIAIAQATGGITMEAFQSYLTTDPLARAQYAVASEVFNYVQQMTSTSRANTRAMINRVADFLDKPLNPRTTSHLIDEVKENQALTAAITDFQKAVAAAQAEGETSQWARVRMYKDRHGNLYSKPQAGRSPAESMIARHVAREDYIRDTLGINDITNMTRYEKAKVINEGFQAVMLGNGNIIKLF
jgi:predicted DsbA family dithiol-disulfide isomerase